MTPSTDRKSIPETQKQTSIDTYDIRPALVEGKMADQFPMGYGAFPPYGFGMPGQQTMYMPPAANSSMQMNTVMPTPTLTQGVPTQTKKKSTTKKSSKSTTPKKVM